MAFPPGPSKQAIADYLRLGAAFSVEIGSGLAAASLRVTKATGVVRGLEIRGPASFDGYHLLDVFVNTDTTNPVSYINDGGHYYSRTATILSGHKSGNGVGGFNILEPSSDPSNLAVWADITGPAIQARTNDGTVGERIFDGLDFHGNYVFTVGPLGELQFGAGATYASQDTFITRNAAGVLQIGTTAANAAGSLLAAKAGFGASAAVSASTFLNLGAGVAGASPLRFVQGVAPTSPVDGDCWREDNTNTGLKIRINGVTKTVTVS